MDNLVAYLRSLDETGLDTVSYTTLAYALNEAFGVAEEELQPIILVLDPFKKQLVHLLEFCRLLFEPNAVESIPFFFYAENSMVHGYSQYLSKFEGYHQRLWEQEQALQRGREQEMIQLEKQRQWLEKEAAKHKDPKDKSGNASTGGRQEGGRSRLGSRS